MMTSTHPDACRDIGRRPATEHGNVYSGQRREGAQSATTQGQDLRAPRVIDDPTQRSVEIKAAEERPALEMLRGRVDRCPYGDGNCHCAGVGVSAGAGVSGGNVNCGIGVGATAEKSGTTFVIPDEDFRRRAAIEIS